MSEGDAEQLAEGVRAAATTGFVEGRAEDRPDLVAREEPLEIQVNGAPLAVVMRTPGADVDLVTGFLLTERVVACAADLESVRACSEAPVPEAAGNVVRATLAAGASFDLERARRNLFAASSCGVCGKASLEAVIQSAPPLDDATRLPVSFFYELPARLRAAQPVFGETGGLHAAGLFDAAGRLRVVREDVGRHNAVDKVVGHAARQGWLPLAGHVLLVSGRVSFEIVQKALAARIPVLAAVSAPSSLAVDLAEVAGMAIAAFLRGRSLRVFGARERITTRSGGIRALG